jgi:glycosyltransferase involved in cell wall biosynthesis
MTESTKEPRKLSMDSIMVSICCQTYNHEAYIGQAVESFLMQKTNFKFEILLRDDASTDGTAEICKEYARKYPELINLLAYEENQFQKGVSPFGDNVKRAHGKYIAICEGDDYWTDPLKLQKQVDFLEANEEYSICWTNYLEMNTAKSNELKNPEWNSQIDINNNFVLNLDNIFNPYCTLSLTVMFKVKCVDKNLYRNLKYPKDNTLYAIALSNGKGMLLNFTSSVYRIHVGGIYSSVSEFKKRYYSYLNLKEIVDNIPNCNNTNLKNIRDGLLKLSFIHCPRRKSRIYLRLIFEGFEVLGFKKTLKLINKKYNS